MSNVRESLTSDITFCINTTVTVTRDERSSHTLSFITGEDQAVPWLDELVTGLSLYQTAILQSVPPSAVPVAKVTLDQISPPTTPTPEDKYSPTKLREEGNKLFRRAKTFRDYRKACLQYNRALNACAMDDVPLRAALRSNLALVAVRMEDWQLAIAHADAAHALTHDIAVKPLFRRGSAFTKLSQPVRAIADLQAASVLCPEDATIQKELDRITKLLTEQMAKGRQTFAEVYNVMLQSPLFKHPLPVSTTT